MKKTLVALAVAFATQQALALTITQNFLWSNTVLTGALGNPGGLTVNQFNPVNGFLSAVTLELTGTSLNAQMGVQNPVGNSAITVGVDLSAGLHTVTINNVSVANVTGPASAAAQTIAGGAALVTFTLPVQPLGGGPNAAPSLASWYGVGTFPILASSTSGLSLTGNTQNQPNLIGILPSILSNVSGKLIYTFSDVPVPEAETYVAGLALIGFAGYGFYRRNRVA